MGKLFFTPGPSQLHPEMGSFLKDALHADVASLSHRSSDFERLFQETTMGVKRVMNIPDEYKIFFLGSATEAMERIIQNCVRSRSMHLVNGSFSERFYAVANELGKNPSKVESPLGASFDFSTISTSDDIELLCITQNETSTGAFISSSHIEELARKFPEKLVAVDVVSSAPFAQLPYPEVDLAFFSVQKLFGLPAGLGVMAVSPRAMRIAGEIQSSGISTGSFHSFSSLAKSAEKSQTPETPSSIHIYLLGRVCQSFLDQGPQQIQAQLLARAKQLYELLDNSPKLSPFVQDPLIRSPYVITIEAGSRTNEIVKSLGARGLEVGDGYGQLRSRQFRIANFPAINLAQWGQLVTQLSTWSN